MGSWGRVVASRWTGSQLRKLIITGVASVAALFVNPFGWHLVYYPFDFASKQKPAIMHIQEWMSLDFHDLRGKMIMGLLFGIILGALIRKRSWDLGQVLVLAVRHIPGANLRQVHGAAWHRCRSRLAQLLDFFPPYHPEDETPRLNVVVILFMVGFMIYKWPHEAAIKRSIEETYPSGVIPFLKAHPPQGNVLNLYLWGGYLGFQDPDVKDFIDSRVDIFQYVGVFDDYLTLMGADAVQHRPDPILDKYNIRYVLFPPSDSPNPLHAGGELVYVLEHDPHWKEIYKDKVCVLLEKQ